MEQTPHIAETPTEFLRWALLPVVLSLPLWAGIILIVRGLL